MSYAHLNVITRRVQHSTTLINTLAHLSSFDTTSIINNTAEMIHNKSTLLLLLLSILGTALSDGPAGFGCYNSIVATKRGDSWTYGDNGYQNFCIPYLSSISLLPSFSLRSPFLSLPKAIVITNQSPNGCNAVVCAPLFYFVECSLFNQWNWAPQCINCNADGTPQSRQATIGGPASLDSALAPGQVSFPFIHLLIHSPPLASPPPPPLSSLLFCCFFFFLIYKRHWIQLDSPFSSSSPMQTASTWQVEARRHADVPSTPRPPTAAPPQ